MTTETLPGESLGLILDPYDRRATSANFQLDAWLATFDPELLGTEEGRKALTRFNPLLFALLYLRHHLESEETGGISFADCHLDWFRLGRQWAIPDTGLRGWRHSFASPRNSGKALALDTPVLTVDRGWTTHGDLKIGDRVFDECGKPCNVVGVSEVWQDRPCYELTFSDDSTIVADQAHEWTFSDRWSTRGPQIVDTATVADRWELPTSRNVREARYSTPIAGALDYLPKTLPIAPYALGAWLGDGHSAGARISVGAADLDAMTAALKASGETFKIQPVDQNFTLAMGKRHPGLCSRGHDYGDKRGDGRDHCRTCIADGARVRRGTKAALDSVVNQPFVQRLAGLGVLNDKHIPAQYLTGSVEQRMELLRGLMDTDGTIGTDGRCEFSVTNERLALDTAALIRSLSIKVNVTGCDAKLYGRVVSRRWRVSFSTGLPVFAMPRKLARVRLEGGRSRTQSVIGVRRVADQATSCIQVDSPSHLYLAGRSLIPTHNSTIWYTVIPIWAAAHEHIKFIATFANGATQAEMHLQTFRTEAAGNKLLRNDFPKLCAAIRKPTGRTVADNEGQFQSQSGFVWVARGIDVASLGMKVGDRRPDVLVLDDIEKDESRYSPGEVKKRLSTILDAIFPLNERAKVVIVGTVTRPGSINHQLVKMALGEISEDDEEFADLQWIKDERITPHYYPPIIGDRGSDDRRSCWPAKWSLEYLESIEHTRNYQKNFKNNPRSGSGMYWSDEDIRYGVPPNITRKYLFVDPPVTQGVKSDRCGLVVLGYAPGSGKLPTAAHKAMLGDDWKEGLTREEAEGEGIPRLSRVVVLHAEEVPLTGAPLLAKLLRILEQHPGIYAVVVETNNGGDLWKLALAGLPVPLVTFTSSIKKEIRISRTLDHTQRYRITFAKPMGKLEDAMTAYPKIEYDDLLDAFATGSDRLLNPPKPKKNRSVSPR